MRYVSAAKVLSQRHSRLTRYLSSTRRLCQIDSEKSLNSSSYAPKKDAATPAELRRYEKREGWKGVFGGLFAISGILGGFILYQNYQQIYAYVFNRISPEDDVILNKVKDVEIKKKKKRNLNFSELPQLTNDRDSSIPGVYTWGDNCNLIVSEDPKVKEQRFPKRFDWFDGKFLSKVHLCEKSALAIDEKGDLIQWGKGFDEKGSKPDYSVKGQHLIDANVSNGAIYALTKKGEVLIIPESKKDQNFTKNSTWWKFWTNGSVKYPRLCTEEVFEKGEKIKDLQTGSKHLLLLTNKGKVYTGATGMSPINSKSHGQYGLLEYNQFKLSPEPNKLHEVKLLNNEINTKTHKVIPRFITQIATGDNHSIALDENGELYSFGENYFGQLGHDINGYDNEIVSIPKKIDLIKHNLVKRGYFPKVVEIKASGDSTFAKIQPVKMFHIVRNAQLNQPSDFDGFDDGDENAEEFIIGFGSNLKGQLGSSKFIHSQHVPSKIQTLSEFKSYNESSNKLETIKPRSWSFVKEQNFMVLENDEVLHWGGNDHGELGNGKKSRISKPMVMPALIEPGYTLEQVNDIRFVNRMSLDKGREIVAGVGTGAIFYKKEK